MRTNNQWGSSSQSHNGCHPAFCSAMLLNPGQELVTVPSAPPMFRTSHTIPCLQTLHNNMKMGNAVVHILHLGNSIYNWSVDKFSVKNLLSNHWLNAECLNPSETVLPSANCNILGFSQGITFAGIMLLTERKCSCVCGWVGPGGSPPPLWPGSNKQPAGSGGVGEVMLGSPARMDCQSHHRTQFWSLQ